MVFLDAKTRFRHYIQGRPEACTPYTNYRGPGWDPLFMKKILKFNFGKQILFLAIRLRLGILSIEFKTGPLAKGP